MVRPFSSESPDVRILGIAAAHMRKFGLKRTTVVAIAEEAGMSHANVYRYFPSKTALIEAVTEHWLRPVEASIRQVAEGPDPAYDKLERIIGAVHRAYREKLETDPQIFNVFVEAARSGLGVARRHRNRLQAEIGRVVEEGMSSGVFAETELRRALALVFDALHRFIHPAAVSLDADAPRGPLNARFERVMHLVVEALSRRKL